MSYTPIYCNKEGIVRKTRARLNIKPDSFSNSPYVGTYVSQEIDDELVDQIIEQQEDYINLILNQLYDLPLRQSHKVLTNIVESLVISELLKINYQGQNGGFGGDNGSAAELRRYANTLLFQLTYGHNIYIEGVPPAVQIPGGSLPQPLKLIGERPARYYDDTITRQVTYVERKIPTQVVSSLKDIDFEGNKSEYYY